MSRPTAARVVLLDRDGTLNVPVDRYVMRAEDLVLLPHAAEAVALANTLAEVVVITNQQGVGRGLMSSSDLDDVHRRLRNLLAAEGAHLDGLYVCTHLAGTCDCRKPLDGMFRQVLADRPTVQATDCAMVGDAPSDVLPALGLSMRAFLVCRDEVQRAAAPAGAVVVGSVLEAIEILAGPDGWPDT